MVEQSTLIAVKWAALAMLFVSGASLSAFATEECGTEIEPCERPRPRFVIRTLKTTGIGQLAPGFQNSEHPCSQFRLTKRQVRRYFNSAGRITQNAMQYVADESACVVVGFVKFSNGMSYTFSIGELRDGRLAGSGDEIEYLYCSKCQFAPFYQ